MTPSELAAKAERLRSLHVPGDPVVLPNAWDASSAGVFAEAGFFALATSSGAVAAALGYPDGEGAPADEMFDAIARIARSVDVPVSADIERGYGLAPDEIADRLLSAGAVGCNLEDSDPRSHQLVPAEDQAARLRALREACDQAGVPVVLNARVDVHLRNWGDAHDRLGEAVRRARLYLEAGADCVYPIFLNERDELRHFVHDAGGAVNAVFLPHGSSISAMASLGVARITFGSGLHRATNVWLSSLAGRITDGHSPY